MLRVTASNVKDNLLLVFFVLLTFLSYLPKLSSYPFKNEESLRVIVAFEMWYSKNYFQPYFLGETYLNKPPLFNWFIILYSYLFGWSEITARAISLTFLFLTAFLVILFSYSLFKKLDLALFSSLVFLTFGNVLFFYGFLGEIDITFTFFIFSGIYCLYLWSKGANPLFAILAGIIFGFSSLLKGFPSYAFLVLSLLALSLYYKRLSLLLGKWAFVIYFLSLLVPLLWLLQTIDPFLYLSNLWRESFSRVGGDFSRVKQIIFYPLVNFKDLLPWSFIFLVSLYSLKGNIKAPQEIKLLLLVFLLNYLPYWFSNSAGRYILPLYPILAIVFSFYIFHAMQKSGLKKFVFATLIILILLRFLYGFVFFSYAEASENSRKRIAKDMASLVDLNKSIACECPEEKTLCLYLAIWKGEPVSRLEKLQKADYVISCGKNFGEVLKEYKLKGKNLTIEKYTTLNP